MRHRLRGQQEMTRAMEAQNKGRYFRHIGKRNGKEQSKSGLAQKGIHLAEGLWPGQRAGCRIADFKLDVLLYHHSLGSRRLAREEKIGYRHQ
jgi:hypothetical protein